MPPLKITCVTNKLKNSLKKKLGLVKTTMQITNPH